MKKLLSLFMTFVMIFSCIKIGTLGVDAEESVYESVNPYTYSIQNWDTATNTDKGGSKWLGFVTSPFYTDVKTSKSGGRNEVLLFNLVDEANGRHGIEAFCIDVDTGVDNAFYKRIN